MFPPQQTLSQQMSFIVYCLSVRAIALESASTVGERAFPPIFLGTLQTFFTNYYFSCDFFKAFSNHDIELQED